VGLGQAAEKTAPVSTSTVPRLLINAADANASGMKSSGSLYRVIALKY
jgi:hypothetical protein